MSFMAKYQPQLLSILRIVAGLLFLEHGTAKLLHFPHMAMFDQLVPILVAAGVIELVTGTLITLGLFTRAAAFVASGEMAFAFWVGHVAGAGVFWPVVNNGDAPILFCFVFLYLAAAGPGAWSLDKR